MNGWRGRPIEGARLKGGNASIALFARLLGFDATPDPYRVLAVDWEKTCFDVTVGIGEDKTSIVRIERACEGLSCFIATSNLRVSYTQSDKKGVLLALLRKFVPVRLARVTMDQLIAAFCADPEIRENVDLSREKDQRPTHLLNTWGAPGAYADFFATGEILRSQLDSLSPGRLFNFIQHSDTECLFVSPHGVAPMISLVDYPWEDRFKRYGGPLASKAPESWDAMVTTDLNETDVVCGNPNKLEEVLRYVVSRKSRKLNFFSNTCVPTVTGEDVESVVKRYSAESNVPIVYLTVTPKSMRDVFRDLLVNRRRAAEERTKERDQHAVNLIGFPDSRDTKELEALLKEMGVRVNTKLLPDLTVESIDQIANAALNIFYPNALWQHLYDQLLEGTSIPDIWPKAPYGFEGTKRWLSEVACALGLNATSICPDTQDDLARAELLQRSSKHSVGIIVRQEELNYLTDPALTWGVPLVETIREAGFGLEIMVMAEEHKTQKIAELPWVERVEVFCSFEEMRELLRKSRCEAVLSHHFFDWRLTEAGKNRFTLQHFEMGIEGMLRTIERLSRICETPFYKRYARFLRRTKEGLRLGG